MSQSFSLYSELTVRQNLDLHARLFRLPEERDRGARRRRWRSVSSCADVMDALPDALPLGQRQRLSLAVAMIHGPEMLILDEPTSGVDPVARDAFWRILIDLARREKVTIFISTHFMNEAERCDRISLMHAGRVLVSDAPGRARRKARCRHAGGGLHRLPARRRRGADARHRRRAHGRRARDRARQRSTPRPRRRCSACGACSAYSRREALELRARSDPRRRSPLLGSVILMFVMGYGINMDVENLTFAVLDRDQTTTSRDYALNIAGSRYFIERPPLQRLRRSRPAHALGRTQPGHRDPARLRARHRARPPVRDRRLDRRRHADARRDRTRATCRACTRTGSARHGARRVPVAQPATIETRFRYNPDIQSLVAMVPAVIPLLLLLIPAMLTRSASCARRSWARSSTSTSRRSRRLEFLLGKQLPYVVARHGEFPAADRCSPSPCSACRSRAASPPWPPARFSTSSPPPPSVC